MKHSATGIFQTEKAALEYHVIRSKRKTLCIQITKDAQLIVRAPLHLSQKRINLFLKQQEKRITESLTTLSSLKEKREQFTVVPGDTLLYLGKSYPVMSWQENVVQFNNRFFLFPQTDFEHIKPSLISCYRQLAQAYITKRIAYFAPKMQVFPSNIKITRAMTRWGSCSAKGNLNFSFLLIMAPKDAIDYVVVHELAHLREMNHSPSFWKIVETVLPDYRLRKEKLFCLQELLDEQNWKIK